MDDSSELKEEVAYLAAETERLRRERDAYKNELESFKAKTEESISAKLQLLSVKLSKDIQTDIFSLLKWVGALLAVALTIATAGGYFTFSSLIASSVDKEVRTQIKSKEDDIKSLRTGMIKSVADFTLDANKALSDIKAATGKVHEAGEEAVRTIAVRVTTVANLPSPTPPAAIDLSPAAVFTIPIVVHVVYNTDQENISDEQINSQIAILNEDYRARNRDISKVPSVFKPLIGDARIHFELATRDPSERPTIGITRTKTTRQSFQSDDSVKSRRTGGADPWNTERYLNIWVCTLQGGLLRYSQFPGGPSATDGVVIHNAGFGTVGSATAPFNKGRSATGGIGLYLNVRHIWGDNDKCVDGDFVADTPIQQKPNFGKPAFPSISCNNGPNGDLFMNFMDYVDDDAMHMFTKGQVLRMHETLKGARKKLGR